MFGLHCVVCPRYWSQNTFGLPRLRLRQSELEAVIDEVIVPGKKWRVRYRGSFWQASSSWIDVQFQPRQIVRVIGRQNLTLIILPMEGSLVS